MGIIKVFLSNSCPKCPKAKEVGDILRSHGFKVVNYDVGTVEGLAEATFYSVQSTPTFILEDPDENTIADFRGEVPNPKTIERLMSQFNNN